jgi:hypothetical protein
MSSTELNHVGKTALPWQLQRTPAGQTHSTLLRPIEQCC